MENLELMNFASVSRIEEFFDGLFRGTLTDNLFFGEIPTSLKKDWKNLVVVDTGNPVLDHDAYAQGTVLVCLFCPPKAGGQKDFAEMARLEKTLNELIVNSKDEHYIISKRASYSSYDAVNDMFLNVFQVNLLIK